ncbi:uncharacterized protein LOC110731615 [Chenopodium quinoa]|uniref:Uncharacterized protein n=1 Tax=Chenopodium quinoa TaxID=63459 RepID=A0A803L3J1_CHEQI|nr:uncharacterized protein LOC110731615 [Chenopodium quinoa]
MLAAEPPSASPHLRHPKPGGRKPLQPKNSIVINNNHYDSAQKPKTNHQLSIPTLSPIIIINDSNKENWDPTTPLIESMDASLANELTAVKQKLERLKFEKDKTDKMLRERDRTLEIQMTELNHRGEFQKELEIEVDRLYRLKHLKLACTRMSPIRSLREKEMEKKNKESQPELTISESSEKSEENKEEMVDENSTSESPTPSFSSTKSSASITSTSNSNSKSTASSKLLPIRLRLGLGLESALDDK